jgi:hypothetical protein
MRVLVATIIITFVGFPLSAPCRPPRNDAYQNRLETKAWKRLIEQQVARQQAGEKRPEGRNITWKQYWTAWHSEIRESPALPWKGSEFKTDDDMIGYIKARLKAHGLPTYG